MEIRTFRSEFSKHGHNWYMTSRLDFWFFPAEDPFQWHGHLITGGINTTFKVRRCIRMSAFTGWNRRQAAPTSVALLPGAVPVWHATFLKGPDLFAVKATGFWSDWIVAKSADDCLRQLVLQRLNLQAA